VTDREQQLEDAKKRLVNAAMHSTIDPSRLAINAYLNGILQSARVSALYEYLKAGPDFDHDAEKRDEYMDQLIVVELDKISTTLEDMIRNSPRIQVAGHA
jgi:hypothetical protein